MNKNEPYAGIICPVHNNVDISKENYVKQIFSADELWKCPICDADSEFNHTRYEEIHYD